MGIIHDRVSNLRRGKNQAREIRLSPSVQKSSGVGSENPGDLVSDPTENDHLLFLAASGMRWVVEPPVVAVHLTGECGTGLIGVSTDSDHSFNLVG